MAIHFDGINILSKDAYKAYEFYKGLGFNVKEVDSDYNSEWWCAQFDINGSTLWIWKSRDVNTVENGAHKSIIFVVRCDDIQESYKEFKEKGYAVSQPKKMFYGNWEMNLTDPDGNEIEIATKIKHKTGD